MKLIYDLYYPRRELSLIAPTWNKFILELGFGIFAYDFLFYWIHLYFHTINFNFHKEHHKWSKKFTCCRNFKTFICRCLGSNFNKRFYTKSFQYIYYFILIIHSKLYVGILL